MIVRNLNFSELYGRLYLYKFVGNFLKTADFKRMKLENHE